MITIYVYTHDTMADWEIGHVTAELHSGRFFRQDAPKVSLKTVGISKEPVTSMGGLTILPDCVSMISRSAKKPSCCCRAGTPGTIRCTAP